jgi:hypothetical protein
MADETNTDTTTLAAAKAEALKTEATKQLNGSDAWPKVLKLRKPVIANGEEVMELTFREPTVDDIIRCGDPARLDVFSGDVKIVYNNDAVSSMMSTLAAVPPSTIKKMALKDWKNGRLLLTIPFLEDL